LIAELGEETKSMTSYMSLRKSAASSAIWIVSSLFLLHPERWAYGQTTNNLTVSDKLNPGVVYATVTLTPQSAPNGVAFSVTAFPNVYSSHLKTFGMTTFGFNTKNVTLAAGDIQFDSPTTNWAVKTPGGSDPNFGQFDWILQANAQASITTPTLNFHVTNPSVTVATFTTKVNSPEDALFVAHIKGFTQGSVSEHSVGNTGAQPLKTFAAHVHLTITILVLLLLAVIGACIMLRFKRPKVAAQ
jgi:hypothetical protein